MKEWEKNLKPEEYGLTQEEYDRLSDGSTLAAEKKRADQWAEKAGLKMPPFEEILRRSSLPRERWEPNVRLYKPLLWHRMQYLQAICSLIVVLAVGWCVGMGAVHSSGTTLADYVVKFLPDEMIVGDSGTKITIDWDELYVPTYVPEGFELTKVEKDNNQYEVIYQHGSEKIKIMQYKNTSFTLSYELGEKAQWNESNKGHTFMSYEQNDVLVAACKFENAVIVISGDVSRELIAKIYDGMEWRE